MVGDTPNGGQHTLGVVPRRLPEHPTFDLFDRFPDLPWPGRRRTDVLKIRLRLQIAETRERAARNVARQKAAAAQVRARVAARQAAMLARRDSSTRRRP